MQVLFTTSSPSSSEIPVKNQLAEQWSCQHLTASCRGRDISLAHPKKARVSHQERTATWRADSVPSASDTPTSHLSQSRAEHIWFPHHPPSWRMPCSMQVQPECAVMFPVCWTQCLSLEISPCQSCWILCCSISLAAVALSKEQLGYMWYQTPSRSPAVLPRKILDARETVKTLHLQIQRCIAFLHIALTSKEMELL